MQALIFDVDGTLADTEELHRQAFNEAFAEEGLDWHWSPALYTGLLEISGGKERIRAFWQRMQPGLRALDALALEATVERLHELKTAAYERRIQQGALRLRSGVQALIELAGRAGLVLAIATTTSPVNIAALLRQTLGPDWRLRFAVIEDASTAPLKKPHPQVYLQTLARLGLPAAACLAFEDSGNGLRAARGAGLATLVTPTAFTARHDFGGALRVLVSLQGLTPERLNAWHSESLNCIAIP
ncbi:HAD-IA family hydrolase [Paucibacter soli]|uniref:HAD-IA family hydrolase n=1 Tax=Paucibacter soli TaxID=3133433 RepID=UPI004037519C